MDGSSTFTSVITLGDVVETAMRHTVSFNLLRRRIYEWTRDRRHFLISADRVGGEGVYIILVSYWSAEGEKITESFDEWSSYTKAQPICDW